MIETLYIEENILQHPRVEKICARFPRARQITCQRYTEVFNPKAQNFRLQKKQPALILAEKRQNFVLQAPLGYGIGANKNYYFSHMLNCLYDCRYCFLQGMFKSANYILFVNYEGFQNEIRNICLDATDETVHFFSGYDCDSLALEPITHFAADFLPFFEMLPNAWLELRTKSTQVRSLLQRPALSRGIAAFSFTPEEIAAAIEHKAPAVEKRIEAMRKLQDHGWQLGLRFDPLIYHHDYRLQYHRLFTQIFSRIDINVLHSVSLGVFRLPDKFFKKMSTLYPQEKLFAGPLEKNQGMVSYREEIEQEMMNTCTEMLLNYIPKEIFFPCHN